MTWMPNGMSVVTRMSIFQVMWVPNGIFSLIKMSNDLVDMGAKCHAYLIMFNNAIYI
jgi:hypothetical protein